MRRTLLLIGLIVAGCLTMGTASADETAPVPAPVVEKAPAEAPSLDPFQGGDLKTHVPMAKRCREFGQCQSQIPPGEPCDDLTPACTCGWGGLGWVCGRF